MDTKNIVQEIIDLIIIYKLLYDKLSKDQKVSVNAFIELHNRIYVLEKSHVLTERLSEYFRTHSKTQVIHDFKILSNAKQYIFDLNDKIVERGLNQKYRSLYQEYSKNVFKELDSGFQEKDLLNEKIKELEKILDRLDKDDEHFELLYAENEEYKMRRNELLKNYKQQLKDKDENAIFFRPFTTDLLNILNEVILPSFHLVIIDVDETDDQYFNWDVIGPLYKTLFNHKQILCSEGIFYDVLNLQVNIGIDVTTKYIMYHVIHELSLKLTEEKREMWKNNIFNSFGYKVGNFESHYKRFNSKERPKKKYDQLKVELDSIFESKKIKK